MHLYLTFTCCRVCSCSYRLMFNICRCNSSCSIYVWAVCGWFLCCNSSCSIYVWADCGWFLRNRCLWGTLRSIRCFLSFLLSVLLSSEHHNQFVKLVNGHCCYLQYCHALNISESIVFMFYIFKFTKSNNLFLLLFRSWQCVCDKFVGDFSQIHEFHLPLKLK